MNILAIGNSFAMDTMQHTPDLAKSAGLESFTFAFLYVGGCSIRRHYYHAVNQIGEYAYYIHQGDEWQKQEQYSIDDALCAHRWDAIMIQHGTGDKSRYTSSESYQSLVPLIQYVKSRLDYPVKIAFNMAWVADPDSTHHEIRSYDGNQALMYEKLTALTSSEIATLPEVDLVLPTGTAVQNMRTCIPKKLTRDGFHLSYDLGRYIAGLTFLKMLYSLDLALVTWAPEGVSAEEQELAKKAVEAAHRKPFAVTPLC